MRKNIIRVAVVLLLIFAIFGMYGRYQAARLAQSEFLADRISTALVQKRDIDVIITGKGPIQPFEMKAVSSGVSGKIESVLAAEGDTVNEGEPLLILSNSSLVYQKDQARLDLELTKTALESLVGPNGALKRADMNLRQAEIALLDAEDKVDALRIESPVYGNLWSLSLKEGDFVRAGETLATVAVEDQLKAVFTVRETQLKNISIGDKITVDPPGNIRQCRGTVTEISKEGSMSKEGVIEFSVTAVIPEPTEEIMPGMSVVVIYADEYHKIYNFNGHMEVFDRQNVVAKAEGKIHMIHVKEGDRIEEGALLLTLENDSLVFSLEKAQHALSLAEAELEASKDEIRKQELLVRQAQVSLEDKESAVEKLTVKSPILGRVISLSATAGDDVQSSETLFQVANVTPLTVVIPVDELDVPRIRPGLSAEIEVDALPGAMFQGEVQKISLEGMTKDGVSTYDVTVNITPNEESSAIRLNMSAHVALSIAESKGVLSVPVEAITWQEGQAYVQKLEDSTLQRTKVKVGAQSDLYAEIAAGLEEGDTVVLDDLNGNPFDGLFLQMHGQR